MSSLRVAVINSIISNKRKPPAELHDFRRLDVRGHEHLERLELR
jgi:hypothetical protein